MTWKEEIAKVDPRHIADMVNEINDACQDVIQNVGDGSSFRKQTLEKIVDLLNEAQMIAINEY